MRFEKLPDNSEYEMQVAFDSVEEATVVRAVYREQIVRLAQNGNIDSISEHELFMSDYGLEGEDESPYVAYSSIASLMCRFREFYERTDEAVIEIAHSSEVPAHDNDGIKDRIELGAQALQLAEVISDEAIIGDDVRALRDLPETEPDRNINL